MNIALDELEEMGFCTATLPRERLLPRDKDAVPTLYCLPSRNVLCPSCDGNGVHDHPAFRNGFSSADEWADEDFREGYRNGAYDVTCEECHGAKVVREPDPGHPSFTVLDVQILKALEEQARCRAEIESAYAAERRMGC